MITNRYAQRIRNSSNPELEQIASILADAQARHAIFRDTPNDYDEMYAEQLAFLKKERERLLHPIPNFR